LQLVVGYQTLTFVGLGRNITLLYAWVGTESSN
jgi:hypothetical protein